MKKIIIITSLAISILSLNSCKKDFLTTPPLNNVVDENIWKNSGDAEKGLNAIYSALMVQTLYSGSFFRNFELASDDVTWSEIQTGDTQVDDLSFNSTQTQWGEIWRDLFAGVQRSNLFLEKVEKIDGLDANRKKEMIGEAKFFRALFYFDLVRIFGGVPIYTSNPNTVDELYKQESSEKDIYNQIYKDLEEAASALPLKWPERLGRPSSYAARALHGKAALYNKDYVLAVGKLQSVVDGSGLEGKFVNLPYKDVFDYTKNNTDESLFEIQFTDNAPSLSEYGTLFKEGGISGTGNTLQLQIAPTPAPISGFGQIIATKNLFHEFEFKDPRLLQTLYLFGDSSLKSSDISGVGYTAFLYLANRPTRGGVRKDVSNVGEFFHIKKYAPGAVSRSTSAQFLAADSPVNMVLLRYAEVKLMLAEALLERDGGPTPSAVQHLNDVRRRARNGNTNILPDFPGEFTYTGNEYWIKKPNDNRIRYSPIVPSFNISFSNDLNGFRKAIVHERRVELAFEFNRFFDMVRWSKVSLSHPGAAKNVFESKNAPTALEEDKKKFSDARHYLFPKPQIEVDKSRNTIKQNPGY